MQATMNDVRRETADAVNESTRMAAEASRRAIEGMQTATQAGRGWLEESSLLNRKLFAAWASGVEATWKVGFEMQNALLTAGFPVYSRATEQWVQLTRQAQEISLEVLRMNARVVEKTTLGAVPTETTTK
jgi:hypothetical protein